MIRNFLLLLKRDVQEGIMRRWKLYLFALIVFLFSNIAFLLSVKSLDIVDRCCTADYILNAFIGNEPFDLSSRTMIDFPITWFTFYSLLIFIIGFYIVDDLKKNATVFLLRIASRRLWWLSKLVWCIFTVVLYYLIFLFACIVISFVFGEVSFSPNKDIAQTVFAFDASNVTSIDFLITGILPSLFVSIAIAIFEILLCLIVKPVYSYVVVLCYLVGNIFACKEFLILNYSMFIRSDFMGANSTLNGCGLVVSVAIIVVCIISGMFIIKNKDLI